MWYDGVADRALEHAYVVVAGNTITAVGPQTELPRSMGPSRAPSAGGACHCAVELPTSYS